MFTAVSFWKFLGNLYKNHQLQISAIAFLLSFLTFILGMLTYFSAFDEEETEYTSVYFWLNEEGASHNNETVDLLEGVVGQMVDLSIEIFSNASSYNDYGLRAFCEEQGIGHANFFDMEDFFGNEFIIPTKDDSSSYNRSDCRTKLIIHDRTINGNWESDCPACLRLNIKGKYRITETDYGSRIFHLIRIDP